MSSTKAKRNAQSTQNANVVVIGISRSGKSSIIKSLLNKDLIISQGLGRKVEFQPDDSKSNNKNPSITSDPKIKLTFIEYPGFEDMDGLNQDKINLFLRDQSLSKDSKILLVTPASECEQYNEDGIEKYFEILAKNSKVQQNLENNLGLVITKGETDITGVDYIEQLEDTCTKSMKKWCNFFKSNFDHVFVFPLAERANIGKKYEFDDQKRILQFVKGNSTVSNTNTNSTSLDTTDKPKSQSPNFYKVREIVRNIFSDIFFEYRKDKSTSNLRRWLYSLNQLKSFADPTELKSFFQRNIPNYEHFDEHFQELEKFKDLKNYSDLQENLSSSLFETIQELESLYQQADLIEKQEEKSNELKRREEEQKQNAIDQKREREEFERTMAMHKECSEQQKILIEHYEQTIQENEDKIQKLKSDHHKAIKSPSCNIE